MLITSNRAVCLLVIGKRKCALKKQIIKKYSLLLISVQGFFFCQTVETIAPKL